MVENMSMVKSLGKRTPHRHRFFKYYQAYLFILPTLVYFIIFSYGPMYGVQIAFKNFMATRGIWGSPWVGWNNFEQLFRSFEFVKIVKNTFLLSVENLLFTFPIPIIFALLLNSIKNKKFKRLVQTTTYAPYFISTVVIVGLIFVFTKKDTGVINILIQKLGFQQVLFMGDQSLFRPVYIVSAIWQYTGWNSIIYIAALSNISFEQHEAAIADGANKLQRILYIDLPGIIPTAVILFILSAGQVMKLGFEKAFLMQTSLNLGSSEVISTYVYKIGIQQAQYSFASATDLFNSVINLVLLLVVNTLARRLSDTSLW